jgi:hypothetical protein
MQAFIIFYQEIFTPSPALQRINLLETKHREAFEAMRKVLAPQGHSLSSSLKMKKSNSKRSDIDDVSEEWKAVLVCDLSFIDFSFVMYLFIYLFVFFMRVLFISFIV